MSIKFDEQTKRILAYIVVLNEHIDKLDERYPDPKSPRVQAIVDMFERKILHEIKKLKNLTDDQ